MKKFIATFYSHFGAIHFNRICQQKGLVSKMIPVPRDLSSSCGTCVLYESEFSMLDNIDEDEVEQLVEVLDKGYNKLYP